MYGSMVRPICVPCGREMRCAKNGFLINDPAVGVFPATYWFGDKFECPDCQAAVVVNCGASVTAQQCDPSQSLEFTR